jgi:predicted nucleic acid-binding protein
VGRSMKLYLDTSALKRPFDDQAQPRIALETEAIITVLAMIQSGEASLLSSSVLEYENAGNPQPERRRWTSRLLQLAAITHPLTATVQQRASLLERQGLKPLDALHVACAEAAPADYLLTCDDRLPRRYRGPLPVLNPVRFILKLTEQP